MGPGTEPSGGRSIRLRPGLSVLAAFAAALLLLWSEPAVDAQAATFPVSQTTDAVDANVGDGICDVDAATPGNQCSLRAAIQTANGLGGSHIVSLPAGTYTLSVGGPVAANARGEDAAAKGDLDIVSGANITVRSADTAGGTVTIDGGALDRVFQVMSGGTLTLVGITVTNGNPGSGTGGSITTAGTLTLVGSTVSSSTTTAGGGGIYVSAGTATLEASAVSGNTGSPAGGLQVLAGTSLTMRNSVVSGNTGTNGGGLRINGTATITDSTIRDNAATTGGGINLQDAGTLTLTRSTVSGNTTGGGLRISKASGLTTTATLTNVTISGNGNGAIAGSGIMIVGNNPGVANVSLTNVTIGTNTGGGFTSVSTNVTAGSPGSVTLTAKNTIFAGGCGNDGSLSMGIVNQGGSIHAPGGSCPGGDASINGLLLGSLTDNGGFTQTLALGATSDAVDIGSGCPTIDQRGLPRAGQGTACDSGAFEVKTSGNGPPVISTIPNQTLDEDYPTGPIAYMVADSDTPMAAANVAASISSNGSPAVPTGSFAFPGTSSGASGSRVLFGTPAADANGSGLVTVQVTDGTDVATAAFTLAVNPVNDAPVFNVVGGNPAAVNENVGVQTVVNFASGMAVGPSTAIAVDENSQTLTGFTVTTTPLSGNLALAGLPTVDTSTGTLIYQPVASTNGTMSINVSLSDDGGTGNGGINTSVVQTFTITVNAPAANQAPVNSVPGAQTTPGNTARVFSTANGNAIGVADVDAGTSNVQVTLTVTSGTLTLGGTSGLSVGGNATSSITATGTLTSLNAALSGLTFTPSSGFSGSVTLTVNTSDLGNTGSGGTLQDQDTVQITVGGLTTISINDAMATEGNSGSSNGIVFTVALSAANNLTVTVSYTSANGSGAAGATGGTCGTPGVDYQATSGTLTFNPGVVSQPITVPVCGDSLVEGNETLLLTLTSPTNATLADGQGLGTIRDDTEALTTCLPRPAMTVTSTNNGDGRQRVIVTAGTSGLSAANRLHELRFGAGTNALVDVGSQSGRAGPFTLPLPERPTSFTFYVQRVTTGQSTTLPLAVVDDCGAWTTFVGGGPTAF